MAARRPGYAGLHIARARIERVLRQRELALAGRTEPLYDASTLQRARLIRTLAEELEVNLPGIDVILHLLDQMSR